MSPSIRSAGRAARKTYAPIFAALGDETRLALMSRLAAGQPRSIRQLTEGTRLSRQAITKHLRVLEKAGVVHAVRSGRESLYEFDAEPLTAASTYLDSISAQWDQTLARLKAFVER